MPTILALVPVLIPLIEQVIGLFSSPTPPTQAEWDALKAETLTTARAQMLQVLSDHGIDPASPQGQALMALIP